MDRLKQSQTEISDISRRAATIALALASVFVLTIVATQAARAQTYKVIYRFTGGLDGGNPLAGLTIDGAGNLYGTSAYGDVSAGAVFKLSKNGSGWIFNPLYDFTGVNDGWYPGARVVFGPDGSLYGTTYSGGTQGAFCDYGYCGTVFNLKPPATACKTAICPWTHTVLYRFAGSDDGGNPGGGDLAFDHAGNVYGTTYYGNTPSCHIPAYGCGVVFKLARSGGGWTESVVYGFTGQTDGALPYAGVILDDVGNLYGTTVFGGDPSCYDQLNGCGVVYQLMPSASGWRENILYTFGSDGGLPYAGLIFDASGNLYGGAASGGPGEGGTIFELSPLRGGWTYARLYGLSGFGYGLVRSLTMDSAGNIYGTTAMDGRYGRGSVFKLTPSTNGWTYTSLYDFTGGSDGGDPLSNVTLDASGNLYGTASFDGINGQGVVWEITP